MQALPVRLAMRPLVLALLAAAGLGATFWAAAPAPYAPAAVPRPDTRRDSLVTTIDATRYGVRVDSTVDNGPAIEQAWWAARRARRPGEVAEVRLPPGVIGYVRLTLGPDSVALVGAGGGEVVTARTADGHAYQPVRRRGGPTTRLRVIDGWAAAYAQGRVPPARLTIAAGEPYLPTRSAGGPAPDGRRWPVRRHHYAEVRDLILDGNAAEAVAAFGAMPADWRKTHLQDSPSHTALNASAHDGEDLCEDLPLVVPLSTGGVYVQSGRRPGLRMRLDGVVVTGYAAAAVVGGACSRWLITRSRFENSAYNHVLYHADGGGAATQWTGPGGAWGGWQHVTLAGYAWTHVVSSYNLTAEHLVVEAPARAPLRAGAEIVDVRSGHVRVRGLTVTPPEGVADPATGAAFPTLWISHGGTLDVEPAPGARRR